MITNPPGTKMRQTIAPLIDGDGVIFNAMNLPRFAE
jgi:hypothetical protein